MTSLLFLQPVTIMVDASATVVYLSICDTGINLNVGMGWQNWSSSGHVQLIRGILVDADG